MNLGRDMHVTGCSLQLLKHEILINFQGIFVGYNGAVCYLASLNVDERDDVHTDPGIVRLEVCIF